MKVSFLDEWKYQRLFKLEEILGNVMSQQLTHAHFIDEKVASYHHSAGRSVWLPSKPASPSLQLSLLSKGKTTEPGMSLSQQILVKFQKHSELWGRFQTQQERENFQYSFNFFFF